MNYYIQNGSVYVGRQFQDLTLHIVDGKIEFAGAVPAGAEVIDAQGARIVPGFIDTHMHGAVGVDVNGATAEDLETPTLTWSGIIRSWPGAASVTSPCPRSFPGCWT